MVQAICAEYVHVGDYDGPQICNGDGYFESYFFRVIKAFDYVDMWLDWFWLSASMWMSFVVFFQIYKLLVANKRTKIYQRGSE